MRLNRSGEDFFKEVEVDSEERAWLSIDVLGNVHVTTDNVKEAFHVDILNESPVKVETTTLPTWLGPHIIRCRTWWSK